jgi:hypothetical protein
MKMFNLYIKEKFLSEEENKEGYVKLFATTNELEKELNKDLFDFDIIEIKEIPQYNDSLKLIAEYMDWAMGQGYKDYNINVVYGFFSEDDIYG